jgi:large subunit ribosomal protein L3
MTRLFMEDGKQIPVTVLQLDNLQVVDQRTADATAIRPCSSAPVRPRPSGQPSHARPFRQGAKRGAQAQVAEFRVAPKT